MNRGLFFTLIALFTFALPATLLHAQQPKGLIISPKRVVFEGNQRIVEVILANRGSNEEKYRISIVNREMMENGQLREATEPAEGEFFAKDILRSSPRQVTLGPKEAQKIRLLTRLKSDSPDGEYRSHLLVQEIPEAAPPENTAGQGDNAVGVNVRAIFGITIPVIVRKGDLSADVSLSNPRLVQKNGEQYLRVDINRSGTKSVVGTANVFADSQKIGILKSIAVYLSNPKRVVDIRLDAPNGETLSGKTIRVTFGAEDDIEDAPSTEITFTAP